MEAGPGAGPPCRVAAGTRGRVMADAAEQPRDEAAEQPQDEAAEQPRDEAAAGAEETVKIICLGDSAVGKSKLLERFLLDGLQVPPRLVLASPELVSRLLVGGEGIQHGPESPPAFPWQPHRGGTCAVAKPP
ncbi:hypothetical protein AV530_009531 [Patagioenas fasciata monilis]|uniref:Uncharacterized protein n=1 Tax=Patagioenas fasciata monilis TaxID=372326 RepID=A0A1V4JK91_PATFA|nr:hypothetical protein AV530_009531 [Patagioenas fasciata monilis]